MEEEYEFKQCPFCNSDIGIFEWEFDGAFDIRCLGCPATMQDIPTLNEAAELWNERMFE